MHKRDWCKFTYRFKFTSWKHKSLEQRFLLDLQASIKYVTTLNIYAPSFHWQTESENVFNFRAWKNWNIVWERCEILDLKGKTCNIWHLTCRNYNFYFRTTFYSFFFLANNRKSHSGKCILAKSSPKNFRTWFHTSLHFCDIKFQSIGW